MYSCNHVLYRLLCDKKIIDPANIEIYAARVRDREDLPVLRCKTSGVIFLSEIDHTKDDHYIEKNVESGKIEVEDGEVPLRQVNDDLHRQKAFKKHIEGKRWLDFGCGAASLLELMEPDCEYAYGVELNELHRASAAKRNIDVCENLEDLPVQQFDIITLFHVFEHLDRPLEILEQLKILLSPGGMILLEVPHAKDILLETFECDPFKRFTLWSEHLVLHTQESLKAILSDIGFKSVVTSGHQRYPLSNHLYWLGNGKPGGHEEWSFLNSAELDNAYTNMLMQNDQTDTLVAIVTL